MRVRPFAEAGDEADAGDPGLASRGISHAASALHREARCAARPSCMLARKSRFGKATTRKVMLGVADALAVGADLGLGHGVARAVVHELRLDRERLAGVTKVRSLASFTRGEERHPLRSACAR